MKTAPTGAPLLRLRDLRREFPAGDETIAVLRDVNLDIAAGEMVAIVGQSGSGKSTLMNILGCLDRPTRGSYQVAGRETGSMLPDELERAFEMFVQGERTPDRAQGGLGLGLALVKRLLELHGGEVSAYSAGLNKGSRFAMSLPRVSATKASSDSQNENVTLTQGASTKVLVVDDNKDAAETMQLLLEAAGHKVFIAHSAQDALALACKTLPAVLCLDIGLPGMDGYELACQFRRLPATAHSALIALTGYGQTEAKERARSAGFDHFLVKPVKLPDLLEVISKVGH